jgi:hypothetical protein
MSEIIKYENKGMMSFETMQNAMQWGQMIANSAFCPKEFKGKPEEVLVAIQFGQELGLQPMQSLQNIAVINGKPSLYGDAVIAVCRMGSDFEYCHEEFDDATMTAICKVKRRGEPEYVVKYNKEDAVLAGLWGKQGPWRLHPKRMLQMRARSFGLRDKFAHLLKGMAMVEEMQDIPREEKIISNDEPMMPLIDNGTHTQIINIMQELNVTEESLVSWYNKGGVYITTLKELTMHSAASLLEKLKLKLNSKEV